jgi:ribonuclease Y
MELQNILLLVAAGLTGLAAFIFIYLRRMAYKAQLVLNEAQEVKREIDTERREATIRLKDELYKKRKEFEIELKRERVELDRLQDKLNLKYDHLEKKDQQLEEAKREVQRKEKDVQHIEEQLKSKEHSLKALNNDLLSRLEQVSMMGREEARQLLFDRLEAEVRHSSQKWIQKVEEEARQSAKEKAIQTVVCAMQRYTADQVAPHSSGIVHLPNEEMKGRIIGKEGRNIKALEMATCMEFVIGDSPDITISGFNPIRKEIARRSLEKLINDGRINPTRIEETVAQCEKEIEDVIREYGKQIILEFNLQGVHPEIVTLLGKLHFRTSYSQNVLMHSKEVGIFARMIAEELGLDGVIALRAGLLHDIGKAVTAEVEGPHAMIGGDIAKRCGESPIIVNAIAAHHEEIPFTSIYAVLVVIADTISASRPGARRETLTAYIKRLEKLEEIANAFLGVKKAFALQAGREIRIIVEEDRLDDEQASHLAREIAVKIENEMNFPGQIKVNVIREKRAIEYAR